jgi:hypothetical protein
VSEFDNVKDKAEQYAQQHPDQVEKGEDAIEQKLGIGEQDQAGQDQAGQGQDNQGQDQQGGDQQPG